MGLFGPPNIDRLETNRNIPALTKALTYQKDWVPRRAAGALGKIGDPRAIPALITALQDQDSDVRRAAAEGLDALCWEPSQDEAGAAYWVAKGSIGKAGAIGTPAIPALITALQAQNWDIREAAAGALGQIGDPRAVPALTKALRHQASWAAAGALGQIGDPSAVPALIAALQANDWVRRAAAVALCQIRDPKAIAALTTALGDRNPDVHEAAVKALVQVGDPQCVAALITALQDGDWDLRRAAAEGLGQIGAPAAPAIPALTTALQDKDSGVRRAAAAGALGQIGDPDVVPALITALQDQDSGVRQAAANALDALGWKPPQDETRAAYWVAKRDFVEAGAIGTPAIPALITALQDQDSQVGEAAARALGQIGGPRAISALITALQHQNGYVRKVAAEALDVLGWKPSRNEAGAAYWIAKSNFVEASAIGAPAIPALTTALQDPRSLPCSRRAAAEALGQIGAPAAPAIPALIAALQDRDWDVRKAAAQALVAIYQKTGNSAPEARRSILAQRTVITKQHEDGDDGQSSDCSHIDSGIGVNFPV